MTRALRKVPVKEVVHKGARVESEVLLRKKSSLAIDALKSYGPARNIEQYSPVQESNQHVSRQPMPTDLSQIRSILDGIYYCWHFPPDLAEY